MRQSYSGFPAAPSVEQAIILAQLLILKEQQRPAAVSQDVLEMVEHGTFSAAPTFYQR